MHRFEDERSVEKMWADLSMRKKMKDTAVQQNDADDSKYEAANSVHIKFKHNGQIEDRQFPAHTTIADVAIEIWERLHISPLNVKLLVKGKRIPISPESKESLQSYDGQVLLVLGTPNAAHKSMHQQLQKAAAASEYRNRKIGLANVAYNRLSELYNDNMRTKMNYRPQSFPQGRPFGLLVADMTTKQGLLSSLFGQGLQTDVECNHATKETIVACRAHAELFLIEWFVFIRVYLNFLYRQQISLHSIHQSNESKQEMDAVRDRLETLMDAFFNEKDTFLKLLLDELVDIEETLDFDCYELADKTDGRVMVNSDDLEVLADFYSLEMVIELLRGDYDREDGEHAANASAEGGMTKMDFLKFKPKQDD